MSFFISFRGSKSSQSRFIQDFAGIDFRGCYEEYVLQENFFSFQNRQSTLIHSYVVFTTKMINYGNLIRETLLLWIVEISFVNSWFWKLLRHWVSLSRKCIADCNSAIFIQTRRWLSKNWKTHSVKSRIYALGLLTFLSTIWGLIFRRLVFGGLVFGGHFVLVSAY